MYDDHYGLSERPFQLTPDPKFWFDTATHRKAMAYLGYGLSQGEGFIVITGDPGAGKTTLIGHLTAQIDPERLNVIKIVTTRIEPDDLLHLVAAGLDVKTDGMGKAQLLTEIERGLHRVARTGKRSLLIVDEAQGLPVGSLEELRMLSNFQAGGHPLLQILLVGQPEFRDVMQGGDRLEQLRQRVIAMHHLDPMGPDEVEDYLVHRLSVVGWQGRPDFTQEAVDALYRHSGGVPRRLNQLAGRVMLFGAIENIDCFGEDDVNAVVADLEADMTGHTEKPAVEASAPAAPPQQVADAASREQVEALTRQIATIENRLEEQDKALRRVLTLLVDWIESDASRPDLSAIRGSAA
ncbi:ExeA family protein [Stakelama marina]|uniref:AAA family ATPase n=1 Tax=Stakelama marina TaxID=2826939 RepID=A0A8T4ICV1_9SPHN|nr:AAA family ATPase [Stakelama marina]MBR0551932.1 AAA family ATPase [Stakelama marina]